MGRQTTLTASSGVYHQQPLVRDVVRSRANLALDDERAIYVTAGVERRLGPVWRATVEAYYRNLDRLVAERAPFDPILSNRGEGWASGVDASLLRRFANRVHAQLSYSYAASRRRDQPDGRERDFDFLQPHAVNAVLGIELSDALFLSTTWKYAVGRPKDAFEVIPITLANGEERFSKRITEENGARLRDTFVANVRVDYRLQFERFALVSFADVYNVFNRINPTEDRFSELAGIERSLGFGAIGTGGFKIEF